MPWDYSYGVNHLSNDINAKRTDLFLTYCIDNINSFSDMDKLLSYLINSISKDSLVELQLNNNRGDELRNKIVDSLKKDVPVTLLCGLKGDYKYYFSNDFKDAHECSTGEHYINITEFVEDGIAGIQYIKIASWGKTYYVNFDELTQNYGIEGSVFL